MRDFKGCCPWCNDDDSKFNIVKTPDPNIKDGGMYCMGCGMPVDIVIGGSGPTISKSEVKL